MRPIPKRAVGGVARPGEGDGAVAGRRGGQRRERGGAHRRAGLHAIL